MYYISNLLIGLLSAWHGENKYKLTTLLSYLSTSPLPILASPTASDAVINVMRTSPCPLPTLVHQLYVPDASPASFFVI